MIMMQAYLLVACASLITHNNFSYILVTSLYNETNQERAAEYLTCLKNNVAHKLIEEIIIFYDITNDSREPGENRLLQEIKKLPVDIHYLKGRPTFELCFNFVNNTYPHKRIIIANADIFFNDTLAKLDKFDLFGLFIALTRWNLLKNNTLQFYGSNFSQDVWIFSTPLRPFAKSSYKLGTPACDIYIAYQAQAAGLQVINPALSVQAVHLHNINLRHYTPTDPAEPFIGLRHIALPE